MDKIFIFGRGDYFKSKYESFMKNYDIVGFLDNAVENQAIDIIWNKPVYNPSKIHDLPKYNIYCVSADFFSMWHQLVTLGVEDNRIKFGAMISPYQEGIEKVAFSKGEVIESKNSKLIYTSLDGNRNEINSLDDLKAIVRETMENSRKEILMISEMAVEPISKMFGSERGKAVDRYYIESFLAKHSHDIHGVVMEVSTNQYTRKYGEDRVEKSIISHVKGWGNRSIKCNFETGEGIIDNSIDCLICTQTLQYIFDLQSAIKNIYRMLKEEGTALITVPGIKPLCEYDNEKWGEYWSFTSKSLERLCSLVCEPDNIEIYQYGNVKIATAYLYGVCCEELTEKDFEYQDMQYPFLIAAKISKKEKEQENAKS